MDLENLEKSLIDSLTKNLPASFGQLSRNQVALQQWNVLKESLPLPLAVLKETTLLNNAKWMRDFLSKTGVLIAPHGKTTMSPQLFKLQMDMGAWGITVATIQQLRVCRTFGINRVLMANQLIGKESIRYVLNELKHNPDFEFYSIVDSVAHVKLLLKEAREMAIHRPLNLLVEIGIEGKRTGCRTVETAFEVSKAISKSFPLLALCGVECFEGLLVSDDPREDAKNVSHLLNKTIALAQRCEEADLFHAKKIIVTAGGSAYFDIVARQWSKLPLKKETEVILRSGCYLTEDSLFYGRLFKLLEERLGEIKFLDYELEPALEVWSYVQSRPEKNLAILNFGKRDCSYDIDLPIPKLWFHPNKHKQPQPLANVDCHIFKLDDQHAYLRLSSSLDIQVGDMLACGISHPCTTFDKWRELFLVDDQYQIISMIKTFF